MNINRISKDDYYEVRIIPMTREEYDEAMHEFLDDYESEIDNYNDYLMSDFSEAWECSTEIAAYSELRTQYLAVIVNTDANFWVNDGRLYELPESYVPRVKLNS